MKQKIMTGDRFILEAMQARKRLRDEVFNTALSTEELQALDLKANAHLFPELVNRDTDLRQRPMKEYERGQGSGRFVKKQKLDYGKKWLRIVGNNFQSRYTISESSCRFSQSQGKMVSRF